MRIYIYIFHTNSPFLFSASWQIGDPEYSEEMFKKEMQSQNLYQLANVFPWGVMVCDE
jgi:hypothetical protein